MGSTPNPYFGSYDPWKLASPSDYEDEETSRSYQFSFSVTIPDGSDKALAVLTDSLEGFMLKLEDVGIYAENLKVEEVFE
jgi:hypothetical protein